MNHEFTVSNLVKVLTDPTSKASNIALSRSLSLRRQWEEALQRETAQYGKAQDDSKGDIGSEPTTAGAQKWRAHISQLQSPLFAAKRAVPESCGTNQSKGTATQPPSLPQMVSAPAKRTTGLKTQPILGPVYTQLDDSLPASASEQPTLGVQHSQPGQVSPLFLAPYAVHVSQTGVDVSVWIRTRALKKGDGQRLLVQLRTHLAHTGVRLAKMVINGKVEWESGNTQLRTT